MAQAQVPHRVDIPEMVEGQASSVSGLPAHFDAVAAYTVLRLSLGLAMFMHGFARFIGGIDIYAHRYIAGFAGVALPHGLVVLFIYAVPYIEVIIGPPIALGLCTRWALLANAALLLVFIFGTSMQQGWSGVETQLVYAVVVSLLLLGAGLNTVSLDSFIGRRRGHRARSDGSRSAAIPSH